MHQGGEELPISLICSQSQSLLLCLGSQSQHLQLPILYLPRFQAQCASPVLPQRTFLGLSPPSGPSLVQISVCFFFSFWTSFCPFLFLNWAASSSTQSWWGSRQVSESIRGIVLYLFPAWSSQRQLLLGKSGFPPVALGKKEDAA